MTLNLFAVAPAASRAVPRAMRCTLSAARRLPELATSARGPVEKAVFVRLMNLSPETQRRLVGKPVEIDGNTLAVDTQLMLKLSKMQPEPWFLPLPKARAALRDQAVMAGGDQPIGEVRTVEAPTGLGRLYVPTGAPETGPMLVFFHGGGFALGDLDSHDAPCRFLAEHSGVRVLSLSYRKAPEHPFPAGSDDALAGFEWAVENAAAFGADPSRIGVGGDSAGGNLAAGVALAVREKCAFQLLIYPVTQTHVDTPSRQLFADGFFLTSPAMTQMTSYYVGPDTDPDDPVLSPLCADIPDGVAPAYVVTAGFDPLRDEGEAYARKLEEAGVKVTAQRFGDQIHGFLNVLGAGRTPRAAVTQIAQVLRENL